MNLESIFHKYLTDIVLNFVTSQEAQPGRPLRSRQIVPTSGLYLAESHSHDGFRLEVLLSAGHQLPNCPHCDAEVEWRYVGKYGRSVIDAQELVRQNKLSEETIRARRKAPFSFVDVKP